jgi:PhzF family phenazine biosynthesis protein
MPSLSFKQVDVFTSVRFKGNPVAVVLDGDGLSTDQMQQIAHWTNLSETTFVLAPTLPGADYQVRIFTPGSELPFAGHPTIGTAHALLEAGRVRAVDGKLTQQCKAGLIAVHVDVTGAIGFTLPAATLTPLPDADCLGAYVRDTGQVVDAVLTLAQGRMVTRDGRIRLGVYPAAITVGGNAVTCVEGTLQV